jgi:hypothetical protein
MRDVQTGKTLHTWRHQGYVSAIAFSPDGKQVVTGSKDKTAVLHDVKTGKTLQTWQHKDGVFKIGFSPDGRQLLTCIWGGDVSLLDVQTGNALHTWGHEMYLREFAFSPDGRQLLTSSHKTVYLRDLQNGNTLHTWQLGDWVNSVAFSPDGKQVLTGSNDKTAVMRDAQTGKTLQTWQYDTEVYNAAFSSDGHQILIGTANTTVAMRPSILNKNLPLEDSITVSIKAAESSYRVLPQGLADRQLILQNSRPVKDEFENAKQFNSRVDNWNREVEQLNVEIQSHFAKLGKLPLDLRAKAFENALSRSYGSPELHDVRYDSESTRFFATLKASLAPNFRRTVSIQIPSDQARAAKKQLESNENKIEVELQVTEENKLIWGATKIYLNSKAYIAEYTDKDFVPPVIQQAANTLQFQTITLDPVGVLSAEPAPKVSDDPKLAKLQTEVLLKEQEQRELAAKQTEEKRLRDRLTELNRSSTKAFNDDLPALLSKLPKAKPNPNLFVIAIGINDYADVPDVPFADRSAKQFAEITQILFGAQKQNVITLTDSEATSGRLRGRIRTLLNRLEPQDQLLFYYAGHGVPGRDGTSTYLLAQDGGPGSYEEPDLKLSQIYSVISQSKVGIAKIFIDACFSGRSGKDKMIFEGIAPILIKPNEGFPDSQRLAVITAGRSDQFSNQDKDRGHRLFSYHLMHVLLEDGLKQEITQVHQKLSARVLNDSRRIGPEFEQEPELFGNGKLTVSN